MFRLEPPIELEEPDNEPHMQLVQDVRLESLELSEELFDAAEHLWMDAGVQESYRRSNEYPLIDCAK